MLPAHHNQVYRRLQRLFLCLSHERTNGFLDILGKDYDREVIEWRDAIDRHIQSNEVCEIKCSEYMHHNTADLTE